MHVSIKIKNIHVLQQDENNSPKAVIGFSIVYRLPHSAAKQWEQSHQLILKDFPWLQSTEVIIGNSRIMLWGHNKIQLSTYLDEYRNLWVLAGSPFGNHTWKAVLHDLKVHGDDHFVMPWDGRCVLFRLSSDGEKWSIWNDWASSMPIYYSSWKDGGIASCLEPIVVATAGLSYKDFSKRGLVELLLLGHFLGTDTLYDAMQVLAPDTASFWLKGMHRESKYLNSVQSLDELSTGAEETYLAEMHRLAFEAVAASLSDTSAYPILLPLSSGMDSRLIACIAKDLGFPIRSYTYGPQEWTEVFYARLVAKTIGISWQRVEMGVNYTAEYIHRWLNWFGCSLHAHGMYQFPFLGKIQEQSGLIPNGFYGNNLAGGDHPNDCLFDSTKTLLDRFCGYGVYWDKETIKSVLEYDPTPYYAQMDSILQNQIALNQDRNEYQRMNILDMWNRQARFIFYQPMMYSYYGYERSPFMYRPYARFCMALPPQLLMKRSLQIKMLERYWPAAAAVPGTFRQLKGVQRKWQGLRTIIAHRLPKSLRPLVGATSVNKMELDCAASKKWEAFYPITQELGNVFPLHSEVILQSARNAIKGSQAHLLKVISVQPIVYQVMLENKKLFTKVSTESKN